MSIERLGSLEGRVERLALSVDALARQVAALAQQLWQLAGRQGGFGGGQPPVEIRIDWASARVAGAAPSSADAYLLLPDGWNGARSRSIRVTPTP